MRTVWGMSVKVASIEDFTAAEAAAVRVLKESLPQVSLSDEEWTEVAKRVLSEGLKVRLLAIADAIEGRAMTQSKKSN